MIPTSIHVVQPLILTVGELGPADCFLHPLQFWQRLSASEMKEHRESSSNLSESSKENLSPSSHSANISSITSTFLDDFRIQTAVASHCRKSRGQRSKLQEGSVLEGSRLGRERPKHSLTGYHLAPSIAT